MRQRLNFINLALAVILAWFLIWLFKVKIIDQISARQKQLQAQAEQIRVLTAGMESLLKIVSQ